MNPDLPGWKRSEVLVSPWGSFSRVYRRRLLLLYLAAAGIAIAAPGDSTVVRTIRPGVTYRAIIRAAGPWRIHLLDIDLHHTEYSLRSARAFDRLQGREKTSAIAERFPDSSGTVVAALNADFFSLETGETVNTQVMEGSVVKGIGGVGVIGGIGGKKPRPRSQFGLTWDRKPFIERTIYAGKVFLRNAASINLGGVNVLPDSRKVTLLNRYYTKPWPDSSGDRPLWRIPLYEAGRRGDTLLLVARRNTHGDDEAGSVLVGCIEGMDAAIPRCVDGDTLKIVDGLQPSFARIRTLVGGAPRIVLDGRSVAGQTEFMEETYPGFASHRHPRTGIGFSRDSTRIILVVVDGRQAESAGMTLPEFADLMIEQGIWQGLNLDGGGSTVMVVEGKIVNSPSDAAGERPIANCLLLVADPVGRKPD